MPSQLRLLLLGPPRVILDGQLVTGFKSTKTQALLFYVAVARRPRSRPELAAMFWPEVNESRANTSLRTGLSNLRRLVGQHLEITRQTVALKPGSNTILDVNQFDNLLKPGIGDALDILQVETAVSLYAGDFLEGFSLPNAPLFEQWATVEETRLRDALLNALQTLALWHANRSEYQASLDYLARLLALDPIRESGHRLKMAVLAFSGQSGAALTHFDICRRILAEELGIDPEPETTALYELILQGKFPKVGQPAISKLLPGMGKELQLASSATPKPLNRQAPASISLPSPAGGFRIDLGDMPPKVDFYGRQRHLDQLTKWLTIGHHRLVAILGIGGVGKTTLAAELTRRLADLATTHAPNELLSEEMSSNGQLFFDQIIWRSLINTPRLRAILDDWLQVLPDQQRSQLPESLKGKFDLLFHELSQRRCLLILDNAESILSENDQAGHFKPGYEEYLQLIQHVAEKDHQSCLLLTSREAPQGLQHLSEDYAGVELLQLGGLSAANGVELLRSRGLQSPQDRLIAIAEHYSGNPLALKLVADTVLELFAGDSDAFFHEETPIFADIRDVLDQQYERLSELEQEILTWLAIERQPVSTQVIWDDLVFRPHRRQFLEALRSLHHRSLLEQASASQAGDQSRFALQNVVMEYITSRFVESICQELERGKLTLLWRHALLKAHTTEYVENSQRRLLLRPVVDWLIARLGIQGAVGRLNDLLDAVHSAPRGTPGYAGANILHLLVELGAEIEGYDFSNLAIWQADLRDIPLVNVSFQGANLKGTLFRDTFGLVISIAISPDGQLLAVGSSEGLISLWRLNEYQPFQILKGHTGVINRVAFSHDGRLLASASFDQTIRLWDVASGQLLRQLSGHTASIFSVSFSPDGKSVFSSSEDQTLGIWDVQSGQIRQMLQPDDKFTEVAVSPDGQYLAGGGYTTGLLYLLDAETGKLKYKTQGHSKRVRSVVFSPDGSLVATAGEDNQIYLWQVRDGAQIATFTGHDNWVLSVAFSPDGTHLASGSADKTIRLWNIQSGDTVRIFRDYKNWVTSVTFSPNGQVIAGGSYDRRVRLWSVRSGRLVHTLRGSLRWVDRVFYSPDGNLLASASFDKPLLLWDVQSGQLVQRLLGHAGSVRCFAFSPDGQTVAAGSDDHCVRLWNTQNGTLQKTLTGHAGFVRSLAFGPDGESLATGDIDGNLHLWQVTTGRQRFTWPNTTMGLQYSIDFSPDGKLLAFACMDHDICLLEVATADKYVTLPGHQASIQLVRFSSDGSLLASKSKDGTIRVWHIVSNDPGACQLHVSWSVSNEELWNIAFSPDGCLLAAQLDESRVGLWDMNDGQLRHAFEQHVTGAGCLAFSQDGALLVAGGPDGTLSLWHTVSGKRYRTLAGHLGSVTSLAVSPEGSQLASSGSDGTIRLWGMQTGESLRVMTPPGPYEGMDISGATGLTPAQAAALITLGAVND